MFRVKQCNVKVRYGKVNVDLYSALSLTHL